MKRVRMVFRKDLESEVCLAPEKIGSQGPISRVYARLPVTSGGLVRKLWANVRETEEQGWRSVPGARANTESRRSLIC